MLCVWVCVLVRCVACVCEVPVEWCRFQKATGLRQHRGGDVIVVATTQISNLWGGTIRLDHHSRCREKQQRRCSGSQSKGNQVRVVRISSPPRNGGNFVKSTGINTAVESLAAPVQNHQKPSLCDHVLVDRCNETHPAVAIFSRPHERIRHRKASSGVCMCKNDTHSEVSAKSGPSRQTTVPGQPVSRQTKKKPRNASSRANGQQIFPPKPYLQKESRMLRRGLGHGGQR